MRVITEYNDKYKILAFTFVTFTFVRVGIYVWKMSNISGPGKIRFRNKICKIICNRSFYHINFL